jgi:hypothetical protein
MKVSKKRTAIAIELRDIGMRLVKEARTTVLGMSQGRVIQHQKATFAGGKAIYLEGRPGDGFDHYLHVRAHTLGSVMNIYWGDDGYLHVSRFVPGEWEQQLRAEHSGGPERRELNKTLERVAVALLTTKKLPYSTSA